jgi:hypothetical protein
MELTSNHDTETVVHNPFIRRLSLPMPDPEWYQSRLDKQLNSFAMTMPEELCQGYNITLQQYHTVMKTMYDYIRSDLIINHGPTFDEESNAKIKSILRSQFHFLTEPGSQEAEDWFDVTLDGWLDGVREWIRNP